MSVRQLVKRFGGAAKPYAKPAAVGLATGMLSRGVKRFAIGDRGYSRKKQAIDRVTGQKDYVVISTRRNRKNLKKAKKWKRYVKRVNKAVASFGPS